MIGRVADRFPFIEVVFFDSASAMIKFMEGKSLSDVVLISLDHDLELVRGENNALIDPGTGDDVARWLANQPRPISPIIVHTTNGIAGDKMVQRLEDSNWKVDRVVPYGDLDWIEEEWFRVARNAIVGYAPKRIASTAELSSMSKTGSSSINLLRSLLDRQFSSGLEYSQLAIESIVRAYQRNVDVWEGDVTIELLSLVGDGQSVASALKAEGPIGGLFRTVGLCLGVLSEWCNQALTVDELMVDKPSFEYLADAGVKNVRIELVEVSEVQAFLILSGPLPLDTIVVARNVQDLKHAIELAMYIGITWPASQEEQPVKSELTSRNITR